MAPNMNSTSPDLEWVTIKTLLPRVPYPSPEDQLVIRTKRLILRPPTLDDLDPIHELRMQPEVMVWTMQGKPDVDRAATQKRLELSLPPNVDAALQMAICEADTGAVVGIGGSHLRHGELGWPVIGYMFRKEAWGKGYATEFVNGFLQAWWSLPREIHEIKVVTSTIGKEHEDEEIKEERITAVTMDNNVPSQKVLIKAGMERTTVWQDENKTEGVPEGEMETLYAYVAKPPSQ